MQKSKIWFHADGNATIGLGHVYRSLALAEMLGADFECHFIIQQASDTLKQQILEVCDSITELEETIDFNQEAAYLTKNVVSDKDIIVLDGYHFKTQYQQIFKNKGCKVVCIDDIHAYHFVADVIINHAGGISPSDYSAEAYTKFYLGLEYALLRKPFREAAKNKMMRKPTNENRIFICFGGADPDNTTLEVLKKCYTIDRSTHFIVVLGSANKYEKEIGSFVDKNQLKIDIFSNLNAMEMVELMKTCPIAIAPPSSVSYEYLSVGGMLFLKVIADNQKRMFKYFTENDIAYPFDKFGTMINLGISKRLLVHSNNNVFDGIQDKRLISLFKNL